MKNKIVKIAFDVASNKTGYAVIINKKLFMSGVIDLSAYTKQQDATKKKMGEIFLNVSKIIWDVNIELFGKNKGENGEDVNFFIVFEHNNHGIPSVSRKLNFYCGAFAQAVTSLMVIAFPHNYRNSNYKFVQAQEWQARIQAKNEHFAGEYTKEHSLKIANALLKKQYNNDKLITSDDEAEAIIMAHFGQELKDAEKSKGDKKERLTKIKSVRMKIQKKKGYVEKYKISGPTKLYEYHYNDLLALENELKELTSYSLFD